MACGQPRDRFRSPPRFREEDRFRFMAASAKVPDSALPVSVPDFRNLGTIIRILLIVNGLAFIAAVMREPRLDALSAAWLGTVSFVEPHLLLQLLLLYV